jgi:predicted membrane protein (TIGR00267 family)
MKKKTELYLRNVIFGISDSLVSTVGLLAGIDVSGATRQGIILTGIVYAFVEAFSMAVGSFLSEKSVEDYESKNVREGGVGEQNAITASIIMFVTFVVASFIPIVPYILFDLNTALWVSIILSVIALFIVGLVSAKITKSSMFAQAWKTALLGGAAIGIGVLVGKFVKAG